MNGVRLLAILIWLCAIVGCGGASERVKTRTESALTNKGVAEPPALRKEPDSEKWTRMLGARLNMSPVTTISFYRRTDLNDGTYLAETQEGSLFIISRIVFFKAKKESIDIVGATSPKNYLMRPQIVELKPYKDALWVFSKTVGGKHKNESVPLAPWPSTDIK